MHVSNKIETNSIFNSEMCSKTGENTGYICTSSLFSQSEPYRPVRICATFMQNCGISLKKSTMLHGTNRRNIEISPSEM
jgi:hypothetical protein